MHLLPHLCYDFACLSTQFLLMLWTHLFPLWWSLQGGSRVPRSSFVTHFNTYGPVRLLYPLIRLDSSNWISLWNEHPFDTQEHPHKHTAISRLFAQWLLFLVKAANRSKLLPTTCKYQVPNCSAVMCLSADQSNYGPAKGSLEPKWDGERGLSASGDGRVEGTWLLGW